MSPDARRARLPRALCVVSLAFAFVLTLAVALVAGVLLHVGTPAARRVAAETVSRVLSDTFAGEVEISRVGALGVGGFEDLRVRVEDPAGVLVLDVEVERARFDAVTFVRSLLRGSSPLRVRIPLLEIEDAEIVVDAAPGGDLRLANAFETKAKEEPEPEGPPGRGVVVDASKVVVHQAWVHGEPPAGPPVDATIRRLSGSGYTGPDATRAALDHARIVTRAMPRGLDVNAALEGRFAMTPEIRAEARLEGRVGGMPTALEASLDGERVDGRLDVRDPTGARVSATANELDIDEEVALHAEVHGALSRLDASVDLSVGAASAEIDAIIDAEGTPAIHGTIAARRVDLSAVLEDAPETELGLDARADVVLAEGGPRGEVEVTTLPGRVAGERVPSLSGRAALSGGAVDARVRIDELVPAEIVATVRPTEDGRVVEARAKLRAPALARLPIVGRILEGTAEAEAHGRLVLPEGAITGRVEARASDLGAAAFGARTVGAEASVTGTLDRPVIAAEARGRDLRVGDVTASRVAASARVAPEGGIVSIADPRFELVRLGYPLAARARVVRVGEGVLDVEEAVVEGLGAPIVAELERTPRALALAIAAPEVDLARVARLAALPSKIRRGSAALAADLEIRDGDARGRAKLFASGVAAGPIGAAELALETSLDERALSLEARADLGGDGRLVVDAPEVVLAGKALDRRSWARATGAVRFDAELDLGTLAELVPPATLPARLLAGRLVALGTLSRRPGEPVPEVHVHAHTRGLAIAEAASEPTEVRTRVEGVDVAADVFTDAPTGQTAVAVRALDALGLLVALDAKARLPLSDLLAGRASTRDLMNAPLSARVVVPPRAVERVPASLGLPVAAGIVRAELEATGTVLDPRVRFEADARGLDLPGAPDDAVVDLVARATYDGAVASLALNAAAPGGAAAALAARVEASARDLLEGKDPASWRASARARFDRFRLEAVSSLAALRVRGRVTGEIVLAGLNVDGALAATLDFDELRVGGASYRDAKLFVRAAGGRVEGTARLDQAGNPGFLDLRAAAGLDWGNALLPAPDPTRPIAVRLRAESFSAAVVGPFVRDVLNEVSGRIDADAAASIDPKSGVTQLGGTLTLEDGAARIVALGREVRQVNARVTMSPGTIRVDDASARTATGGRIDAEALVKLDGLKLRTAYANVWIPKNRPVDLALEGRALGEVSGSATLRASATGAAPGTTSLRVDVPELRVELPAISKGDLQDLEPHPDIRVGTFRGDRFVTLPLGPRDVARDEEKEEAEGGARLVIDVRLQRAVIERGNSLRVVVAGEPRVVIADETRLYGQIRAVEGMLDVQGKEFEVEKAVVTFTGESPPNPTVVATAKWDTETGTLVFADYTGPVDGGKLELRSEPPMPKNEILSLVLFGTRDAATAGWARGSAGGPTDPAKTAVGIGGAFAAQGLNEAIEALSGVEATARIDTTQSRNPRPEVEVQLSPRVSVEFSHVLGTPPITEPDRNLATLEWRIRRNWALETTVGDRGRATLDAVWEKRY